MPSHKTALMAGAALIGLLTADPSWAFGNDPYFALSGGLNFVPDITLDSTSFPLSTYPRMLDFNTGFAGTAAFGGRIGTSLRLEKELSYRFNTLDSLTVQIEGPQGFDDGSVSAFGVMANGWIDIPTGTGWTPYIGGGIGAANVHLSLDSNTGAPCTCWGVDIDSSQWVFAYQLGAGVAIGMGGGITATLDYRYFATSEFSMPFTSDGGAPSGDATGSYSAHSALFGLRFPLGGP